MKLNPYVKRKKNEMKISNSVKTDPNNAKKEKKHIFLCLNK